MTANNGHSGIPAAKATGSLCLQLWTLNHELSHNPENTLNWVCEHDFSEVEVAGFADMSAKRFAKLLSDRKLQVIGMHGPHLEQFLNDEEFVEWAAHYADLFNTNTITLFRNPSAHGLHRLQTSGPDVQDLEKNCYTELARRLRNICKKLNTGESRRALTYHCFPIDLFTIEGNSGEASCGLRILLDMVEYDNFGVQLDTYWLEFCPWLSIDGALEITRDRVKSIHVNDVDSESSRPVAIGKGQIDWKKTVKSILDKNPNVTWILEHGAHYIPATFSSVNVRGMITDSLKKWNDNYQSWLERNDHA